MDIEEMMWCVCMQTYFFLTSDALSILKEAGTSADDEMEFDGNVETSKRVHRVVVVNLAHWLCFVLCVFSEHFTV